MYVASASGQSERSTSGRGVTSIGGRASRSTSEPPSISPPEEPPDEPDEPDDPDEPPPSGANRPVRDPHAITRPQAIDSAQARPSMERSYDHGDTRGPCTCVLGHRASQRKRDGHAPCTGARRHD